MTMLETPDGLAPSPPPDRGPGHPAEVLADDAAVISGSLNEPETFALIYDRHVSPVHRYLSRRLGTDEADDLVAEVFLQAFAHRHRFSSESASARPWLFGIATNLAAQRHRSETRRYRALTRAAYRAQDEPSPGDRIAERVDARTAVNRLTGALAGLSHADRDVLLLHAWGELTPAEIAVALDVPVGTVRSRLSRTRSRLRSLLPTTLPEGPDHE